jgi:uncharacterized protein (TIGR00255 family)
MTGFGTSSGREGDLDVTVEIRSVNHRFLSLKQSLPEGLSRYEGEIEKVLRERVARGSVTLSVSMKSLRPAEAALPEAKVVKEYVKRLRAIQKAAGVKGEIEIGALLAVPQLWAVSDNGAEAKAWPFVRGLVLKAVDDLARMREREGAAIRKDIEARLSRIQHLASVVLKRAPAVLEAYQRKLEERIGTLLQQRGLEVAKADVLREVAIYADKCDASEELQRLSSHVDQFRKILASDGQIGRRLDFLTQEMVREANTLTAKSNDAQVSVQAVEIKAELEKIKEQAENIE